MLLLLTLHGGVAEHGAHPHPDLGLRAAAAPEERAARVEQQPHHGLVSRHGARHQVRAQVSQPRTQVSCAGGKYLASLQKIFVPTRGVEAGRGEGEGLPAEEGPVAGPHPHLAAPRPQHRHPAGPGPGLRPGLVLDEEPGRDVLEVNIEAGNWS